jgi:hypothetical protein
VELTRDEVRWLRLLDEPRARVIAGSPSARGEVRAGSKILLDSTISGTLSDAPRNRKF